ncbi:MAG: Methyltransferase type 11 [Pedobacter sp.]|jgi:SAM-dependent methyltransferase|nr:Methyltransferase type 11 [Pedobacter sp.]
MENKKRVFEKYNFIADWYSQSRNQDLMEKGYLDKLINLLPEGASILDLGCGTGKPMMEYLLNHGFQVTGVDASYKMLEIAKENLPSATFFEADMRELSLDMKFDAIMAWHSFFHLPQEDQPYMFDIFLKHMNTNGILIFTSGKERGEAWGMNGGENLFHASLDAQEYRSLLKKHNFQVLEYKEYDAECGGATVWTAQLQST